MSTNHSQSPHSRDMASTKRIALVAHDSKKVELRDWARFNRGSLSRHQLFATGTTGKMLETELGVSVVKLHSGPLGGDQQIGAMIADGLIDALVFFWDPLSAAPHDPDVKALLRIAMVWNVPVACNRASADFFISSPLMNAPYRRLIPSYEQYLTRTLIGVKPQNPAPTDKNVP